MNENTKIYNGKTAEEIQKAARNRKRVTHPARIKVKGCDDLEKQRHKFRLAE